MKTATINPQTLQHPNDPSVMVTGLPQKFLDKSLSSQFPARILTRSEEQKRIFHEAANIAWENMKTDQEFALVEIKDGNEIILDYMPDSLIPIQNEISLLSAYYNTLSGQSHIEVTVGKSPIGRRPHPHDFPVLNTSAFCLGTNWKNAKGEKCIAEESDIFYFPENFWHASTISSNTEKRLTAVLTPMGEI